MLIYTSWTKLENTFLTPRESKILFSDTQAGLSIRKEKNRSIWSNPGMGELGRRFTIDLSSVKIPSKVAKCTYKLCHHNKVLRFHFLIKTVLPIIHTHTRTDTHTHTLYYTDVIFFLGMALRKIIGWLKIPQKLFKN